MLAELLSQLQERTDSSDANAGLEAALALSWESLDKGSRHVAIVLSLFAPAPIPQGMIEQVVQATIDDAVDREWIQEQCNQLMQKYFLQQVNDDEFSVSKSVRPFLQGKLEKSGEGDRIKQLFCQKMVNYSNQLSDEPSLDECVAFLPAIPHIAEAANSLESWLIAEDLLFPFSCIGRFYATQNILKEAISWNKRGLYLSRERLGEVHPIVAVGLTNLAHLYYIKSHYREAKLLYHEALEILTELFGVDHGATIAAQKNIDYMCAQRQHQKERREIEAKVQSIMPQTSNSAESEVNLKQFQSASIRQRLISQEDLIQKIEIQKNSAIDLLSEASGISFFSPSTTGESASESQLSSRLEITSEDKTSVPTLFDSLKFHSTGNDSRFDRTPPPFQEAIFTQIFKRSPDAMTLSTLDDGRFIAVNDRFAKLSGYARHELIDLTSTELNLWPEPLSRLNLLEKLKQQGAIYNEEMGFCTKSGQYKTVRVSAEIIPVENTAYILCSIQDITREKQAQDELELANERDRLLGNIAQKIRKSLDIEEILQTTVEEVRAFLGVERVFIARFDRQNRGRILAESVLELFPSIAGEVIGEEFYNELSEIYQDIHIRVIDDMSKINQSSILQSLVQKYKIKAALGVPIGINESIFGFLVAHQCESPRPWTEFEQRLLFRLSTQVAIAIQTSKLHSEVQYLNKYLEKQFGQHKQEIEKLRELEKRRQKLERLGKLAWLNPDMDHTEVITVLSLAGSFED